MIHLFGLEYQFLSALPLITRLADRLTNVLKNFPPRYDEKMLRLYNSYILFRCLVFKRSLKHDLHSVKEIILLVKICSISNIRGSCISTSFRCYLRSFYVNVNRFQLHKHNIIYLLFLEHIQFSFHPTLQEYARTCSNMQIPFLVHAN